MWNELLDASAWIGGRLALGSLHGTAVVLFAWAVCRWIPRVPATMQAWVWWLVAVKLVTTLLPLPALPLPLFPAPDTGAAAPATAPVVTASRVTGASSDTDAITDIVVGSRPAGKVRLDWLGLFTLIWLAGVIMHTFLLLRAAITTRRLVRRARPLSGIDLAPVSQMAAALGLTRLPLVCISPDVDVPQVVGLRSPMVLLPADALSRFSQAEWRMALCHELLHIRRRDVLLGCVPALAERLYFFHPLARLAAREYVLAREAACDAAVVRSLEVPADDYGQLLVRLGVTRSRSVLVASSAAGSVSSLRRRLEMLQHTSSTTISRLTAAAVAAATLLVVAPVEIVAQGPPAPPALPALPAPPAPPSPPAANARTLPPAAPAAPAPPAPPLAPTAPSRQAAPAAPLPPLPPSPPPAPSSDEVVLRLKSPATEQEAVETAMRVLETQLAQIEQQAANVQSTMLSDAELEQIRRKLEEMMALVQGQARAGQNLQQRSAEQLARQMDVLNRQREALLRQQDEVQRQLAQTARQIERMKIDLQAAQEAARKR